MSVFDCQHGEQGPYVIQAGAASGIGAVLTCAPAKRLTFYVVGTAGVSAGAVQIETADDPTYAATWAPVGSPITVVPSEETVVEVFGPFAAVRARISTPIVGGTVTVTVIAGF